MFDKFGFYSHVNCSVTKITVTILAHQLMFYSHVNYSVTKIVKFIEKIIYITQLFTKYLFNVIYNSRNYSILLNHKTIRIRIISTTVEIILYYLTFKVGNSLANLQR